MKKSYKKTSKPISYKLKAKSYQTGSITAPLLIISAAFIIVIYGLVFMLSNQVDTTFRQTAFDEALYIAESGIQYYRWHLAHSPNDFQDGTGAEGPYVHEYHDSQGKQIGTYSIEVTPPENGSSIVTITATGWVTDYPAAKRTITAQYGIPSLTEYSFLSNAQSWYGSGITVNGRIHSNVGIRMDGVNTSLVTNSQADYQCNHETGCSPTTRQPGVWGSGPNSDLWEYPTDPVDFDSILFDFSTMQQAAIDNGIYLAPSNRSGYHLVFKSNGTVDVYRVTRTRSYHGYASYEGCRRLNHIIRNESFVSNYSIADIQIIFVEDDLWIEGTVRGRLTVAAATFPLQSVHTNIIIDDNLVYTAKDGTDALGLIAHDDIYFARDIPNNFEINAALMAQDGKIIRHGYNICRYDSNAVRDSLTIFGSILSNQKSYWNFGSQPISGFRTRTITYDANLLYGPPPYFPTDGEYEFISWEE